MEKGKEPLPESSSLAALCTMMGGDEYELPSWSAHDLSAILQHLLKAPVEPELAEGGYCPPAAPADGHAWTFGDVLERRDMPREMLVRMKEYAKRAMDVGDTLPRDAAKALYIAVIAHARACGHSAVSSLTAAGVERLGRWCMAQSWVPPLMRAAVREGMRVP